MHAMTEHRQLTVAGGGQVEHHDGGMIISFSVTP